MSGADPNFDLQLSPGSSGLVLTALSATSKDLGLLNPTSRRDWHALEERAEAIRIQQGLPSTLRLLVGGLDWTGLEGLVDRAIWKLDLQCGKLVIGGLSDGRRELELGPGLWWVTLYSFALPDSSEERGLLHLQRAENDQDFLKTQMEWLPDAGTQEEPLVMGEDEGDPLEFEDEPIDGVNLKLNR